MPKLSMFLPEVPSISAKRQAELKAEITGEMFSLHAFRLMGRNDMADGCQKRIMNALVELIEAGAL